MDFTICFVMQLWLNRSMSIKTDVDNGTYEKPHLIYEHTTTKLKLQTTVHAETSITLPNGFNGTRVVFCLTKQGSSGGPTVIKASVSNYSSTLTQNSNLAASGDYKFNIMSHDAVIYKIMYSPNFYAFYSKQ